MTRNIPQGAFAALALVSLFLTGCLGSGPEVSFTVERPAAVQIPDRIRSLAVGEFKADHRNAKWGEAASHKFGSLFDSNNRKYGRYKLVSLRDLKGILDLRTLRSALSDPGSAREIGRLAKVDAVIYGNVTVTSRDERIQKRSFDPFTQSMRSRSVTRRYASVSLTMRMVDAKSAASLLQTSANRDYDSERKKSGGSSAVSDLLGIGSSNPAPGDEVVNELLSECVAEVVGHLTRHTETVTVELEKGKSKAAKTGNALAEAGDWADALEAYQRGLQDEPNDHGTTFNAGVMCEALGRYPEAEQYYTRAFQMDADAKYVKARGRVRRRLGH